MSISSKDVSDLVDALLAHPGRYVGIGHDLGDDPAHTWVARILIAPLPGRAGVSIDYEAFSPENVSQHAEHSVLGRTPSGLVLVVAHPHADTIALLNEKEPGFFVAVPGASPFPMAIRLDVPEGGRLYQTRRTIRRRSKR